MDNCATVSSASWIWLAEMLFQIWITHLSVIAFSSQSVYISGVDFSVTFSAGHTDTPVGGVFMTELLNYSFNWFIKKNRFTGTKHVTVALLLLIWNSLLERVNENKWANLDTECTRGTVDATCWRVLGINLVLPSQCMWNSSELLSVHQLSMWCIMGLNDSIMSTQIAHYIQVWG